MITKNTSTSSDKRAPVVPVHTPEPAPSYLGTLKRRSVHIAKGLFAGATAFLGYFFLRNLLTQDSASASTSDAVQSAHFDDLSFDSQPDMRKLLAAPTTVTPIPNQTARVGQLFDLTIDTSIVFNDADGDTLTLTATETGQSSLPSFLTLSPPPKLLSSYDISQARAVHVVGSTAYVADGTDGLKIIDVSTPTTPSLLGSYDTHLAYEVYAIGSIAYVADATSGLQIIDVSTPTAPVLLGTYDTPGDARDVHVIGSTAYVADHSFGGLQIIDVSTPTAPTLLGSYNTPTLIPLGVHVVGSTAYVADGYDGLQIIDVSNPASPALLSTYNTPDFAYSVYVVSSIAYVADGGNSGLQIIDVSNQASPSLLGSYNTPSSAFDVQVVDSIAYVTDGSSGLQIINVSNPAAPSLLDSYNKPDNANDVYVVGPTAYVTGSFSGDGLTILDVFNQWSLSGTPTNNTDLSITVTASDGISNVSDTFQLTITAPPVLVIPIPDQSAILGTAFSYAFPITTFTDVDSNPLSYTAATFGGGTLPSWLSFNSTTRTFSGTPTDSIDRFIAVTASDQFSGVSSVFRITVFAPPVVATPIPDQIVMWNESFNLVINSFSDPDDDALSLTVTETGQSSLPGFLTFSPLPPAVLGSYTPNSPKGVYVVGSTAYVVYGSFSGLRIIDVSNPAAPSLLGSYSTPSIAFEVHVVGSIAFVTGSSSGLWIIDVSNPAAPSLLSSYNAPGTAVHAVGSTVYVTHNPSGLQIIDVSNPTSPSLLGTYNTPGTADGVYVVGSTAYVADGFSYGLQIINVSNPAAPSLLGSYNTPGTAYEVYVVGSTAYVADRNAGLQIIDVSNPASPSLLGAYDTPGDALGVHVVDSTAYVADSSSGLQIINVSNSAAPSLLGSYNTPGLADHLYVVGSTAYVADSSSGVLIIQTQYALSGTPTVITNYSITVTASDQLFNVSDTFQLTVTNPPPVVNTSIPDQVAQPDTPFSYTVPAATFSDPNGDSLVYSSTLTGGGALPSWLSFNSTAQTFAGTPLASDAGNIFNLTVAASDGTSSASDDFSLAITHFPVVATPVTTTQTAHPDTAFSYTVPAGTFTDPDGDSLSYTATLGNGDPLPTWLTFNPTTQTFSGSPPASALGTTLSVNVTATDSHGGTVSTSLSIAVAPPDDTDSGLSTGTKAAIGAGVGAGALTLLGLGYLYKRSQRRSRSQTPKVSATTVSSESPFADLENQSEKLKGPRSTPTGEEVPLSTIESPPVLASPTNTATPPLDGDEFPPDYFINSSEEEEAPPPADKLTA